MTRKSIEDRFWEKVDKSGDCWIWIGAKNGWGYGILSRGTGMGRVRAHRLSYELANGAIPDGLFVLHKCDNPPCVRPDHLFVGDHAANMQDMHRKDRGRSEYKLNEECRNGHRYTPENTLAVNRSYGPSRTCRQCAIDIDHKRADGSTPTNFVRTHCMKAGHEFTPENTIIYKSGRRTCRKCVQIRERTRIRRVSKVR